MAEGSHYTWTVKKNGEVIGQDEDYGKMLRYVRTFPRDKLDEITIERESPLGKNIYSARELYDRRPW